MVVMRATAVPAFPERCCAEIYPSAAPGEGSLREHAMSHIAFSRSSEGVHDKLASQHAEIEMPVISLYL